MADCIYCGKPAGLLHRKHKECEAAHQAGIQKLRAALAEALKRGDVPDSLPALVDETSSAARISLTQKRELLTGALSTALDGFLESGPLSDSEQSTLGQFMDRFHLSKEDLGTSFTKLIEAAVLRDLMRGEIPKHFRFTGLVPFNFQKDEQVVWGFENVRYYEARVHREYAGGSSGVSIGIAKGVYYHASGFQAKPLDVADTAHIDTGAVAFTTKHIYFSGPIGSMRIPYKKVVAFRPYTDGLGIVRDAASAKPQTFVTGDGWFVYNLAVNLAKL